MHLESIGFKVHKWVCDGAAPKRKFFFINGVEEEKRGRQDWAGNAYALERKIFFHIRCASPLKNYQKQFRKFTLK